MAPRTSTHLEGFKEALEQWTDERFITRDQIESLAMFYLYLVNLAEADGWVYNGHSMTYGQTMSRLVVRGTIDDVPHVVFSSARTPTGCITTFLRKLSEGWLEWAVDRYRT